MKAPTGLLAVLLMLSSASLAQTASSQQTVAGDESSKPEAAKPSTPSSSPTASTPSTEAAAASAGAAPAVPFAPVPFAPRVKLFLEPMNGFAQFLSDAIVKKKVPVVLVHERAKADFVMSGEAHVKKRGFFTGLVLTDHGGGNISIQDARRGGQVFACKFNKVDQMEAAGYIYQSWADGCAKHLKKALEKK